MFARLIRAIGHPDLAENPRYAGAPGRSTDRLRLKDAIRAWMAEQDAPVALRVLEEAEIPAAESATIADIFADPHYAAPGAIATTEDPARGTVRMQGVTPKPWETLGAIRRGAPLLGEHNTAVYGGLLGVSAAEIERLLELGVI